MEYNALNVFIAEVFGTGLLVLLGDGVVAGVLLAKSKSNNAGWIVITAAWAFAVFVGVVVAGPVGGAHLNPAVTIGLAVNGSTPSRNRSPCTWPVSSSVPSSARPSC